MGGRKGGESFVPMSKAARKVYIPFYALKLNAFYGRNWGRDEERHKEMSEILSPIS